MFFILFVLGLEFSIEKVRKQWRVTLLGGSLIMVACIVVTLVFGWFLSFPFHQAMFFGSTISLSSTSVVVQCLAADGALDSSIGRNMLGILVLQDLGLGFLLATMPVLASACATNNGTSIKFGTLMFEIGKVIVRMTLFAAFAWLLKRIFVTRFIRLVRDNTSREIQFMVSVSICFAFLTVSPKLNYWL